MWDPNLAPEQFRRDEIVTRVTLFDTQDFGRLEGAVREDGAFMFSARCRLVLRLSLPFSDLSRFNSLLLKVRNGSEGLLLVGLRLRHGTKSHGDSLEPVSFSGGREELPPAQWRQLQFPMESFGFYGSPAGWADVREIEIAFGRERTADDPGALRIAVGSLEAELRRMPPGPRLTRSGLAAMLRSNLANASEEAGQRAESTREVTRLPYTHDNLALHIPPPHPYPKERGPEVLEGTIMGQVLPDPLPWDANPLGVQEWTHFLNRHHFMRELIVALVEQRDDRYARKLDDLLDGWMKTNPVPVDSNGGAGPGWETLTAAWRLREWLWVAGLAWPLGAFREETRRDMLCSIWEHARSLLDHKGHPNNWIVVESAALALAGLCFPEFRDAGLWVQTGIERLQRAFRRQFLEDAVHFEISPLYHAICVHALLEVREAAELRGFPLPEEFDTPLERCTEYLSALCRPDFTWPSLNDGGSADADYTGLMKKAGRFFYRRDLTWVGTRGGEGIAPERTFHVFPHAGIAAMRSGWDRAANFLVFRAGPPGAFHIHDDALSLDVTARGVPLLVDPGITTYAPGPLTDHYRFAQAHNMVLVDGVGPERSGIPFRERIESAENSFFWHRTQYLDVVVGVCSWPRNGRGPKIAVTRTVVFVKGDYWIVRDTISGEGEHEISTRWQFVPGTIDVKADCGAIRYTSGTGPHLEVCLLPDSDQQRTETWAGSCAVERGWVSLAGRDIAAARCVCRRRASLPVTQAWLMAPFSERQVSGMHGSMIRGSDGMDAFQILFPEGGRDLIRLSADGRAVEGDLCPPRGPGNATS
ncbi:MAG: alginate lyase family protein [Desulfomonile tiedjei]|nr:alginate lyase family protein [Desulfomonile tiedjei]